MSHSIETLYEGAREIFEEELAKMNRYEARRMQCSSCGAEAEASCDCGVPYLPAGDRAAKAVAANPEMSNRAIAAQIGVSDKTVASARRQGAEYSAPAKHTGRDGKSYPARATIVEPVEEEPEDEMTDEESWQLSLGTSAGEAVALRASWRKEFGNWERFETPSSLVTLATQAATAWLALAEQLKARRS
jgi:hypothetical protein